MAFVAPPFTLPSPSTWWQDPKVRARLIAAAVLVAAYALGLAYGSWTRVCAAERCPSISRLIGGPGPQQTSKVYAADGGLITELGLERRTVLTLNEIPLAVRQAFIATEDKRFYTHHGIDYWRIFGALKANIVTLGRSQGATTISMQLARNISPEEAELWKAYPLVLTSNRTNYGDVAPYFVEWLRRTQLEPRFGRQLYEGGLRVYTTLDLDMQQAAERALTSQLDAIEAGVYSKEKFPGRTTYRDYMESSKASGEDHGPYTPYLQGALVAIETGTGYVRAMVGGRDFDDSKYNRATQAIRQPGSTFKPFVYAAAIRAGHPVTEMLDDSPLNPPVVQLDSTPWQPKDYDDTTLGMIPMRQSLFLSRNLSTIKLGMALGEQTVVGEARRFGITTPLRAYPSLHIGANGVRPIEIVAAYTGFATLGTRADPVGILRVEDRQGNILWQPQVQREQVMDPEHSCLLLDMMRDVMRCQPGPGPWRCGTAAGAVAGLSVPMAGKTGTTDDYTDAWFVGFTPELVAGHWVGDDLPQRIMNNAGGGRIVAPAWTMFMRDVYDRRPTPIDWPRPDSLILKEVDWSNGTLATPFCPRELHRFEWFYPGTEPTQLCPVHTPPFGVTP